MNLRHHTDAELEAARLAWKRGCSNGVVMGLLDLHSWGALTRIVKREGWPKRPASLTRKLQAAGNRNRGPRRAHGFVLRRCDCGALTRFDPCHVCGLAWLRTIARPGA